MTITEIITCLHIRSSLSGAPRSLFELGQSALSAGVDVLITSDDNIYITNGDRYYYRDMQRCLMLCGEEVYAPSDPNGNHLLFLDTGRELAVIPENIGELLRSPDRKKDISIILNPFCSTSLWRDWSQFGWTGMEIYSLENELVDRERDFLSRLNFSKKARSLPLSADPQAILKWDELLSAGRKVFGYAGIGRSGNPDGEPLTILRNHLLLSEAPDGNVPHDRELVYDALKNGHCFIGLDAAFPSNGFSFTALGVHETVIQGETISLGNSITFKISLPHEAVCRLVHNGKVIKQWDKGRLFPYTAYEEGYYRVECYLPYEHELRGWIYSNPIFVVK